ncbi:efflux RND transporter permease subunit [Sporosalibacterium faouarense]|uniref:efflux RND transporter permease subunit n=1 Tax=Sporosalibacterium faouarense TaxID=516123 RepID=UPI00192ACE4E|nr:MMPL family transporter [Sporosalibacterium faouarense]
MKTLANFIVEKRKLILIIFLIFTAISIIFIPTVGVNYNLSSYLPSDMNTKKAIDVMDEEFNLSGQAQAMIEDITIPEALDLKEKIKNIDGVKGVIWLDDLVDVYEPMDFLDEELIESYYKGSTALFQIEFSEDDYSLNTGAAINDIEEIIGEKGILGGTAVSTKAMRESTLKEVLSISMMALPLFILILLLTTQSWFEPVIYLSVIGISVLINMGTNAIFGDISFITQSSAAILQFALSMDYSLFLLHRFTEERDKGLEVNQAMKVAIRESFSSLASSCLTTVAGFAALMFMRYRIGQDMSLVLGKGILLSLISVVFLLPGVTIVFHKVIEKTYHGSVLPSLEKLGRKTVNLRFIVILVVCILVIPAYLAQGSNSFIYGETSITSSEETETGHAQKMIEEKFGVYNPIALLVSKGDIPTEIDVTNTLEDKPYISSVQGLVTVVDPNIPREALPNEVLSNFVSENYSRLILTLNTPVESEITFNAIDDLHNTLKKYYDDDYYLIGTSSSVSDIKEVVDKDFTVVNLISIIAVAVIMAITFRSITLPILLVLVIKSAIWINMSVPYFMNSQLSFIGYMIVSAIQLGATIDYAILLTNRYMDNRKSMAKKDAAVSAIRDSGWSVITSALILFVAGMGVRFMSSISGVSEMGLLIGRGAALSGIMVLVVLPQLLVMFDSVIDKTTFKKVSFKKAPK